MMKEATRSAKKQDDSGRGEAAKASQKDTTGRTGMYCRRPRAKEREPAPKAAVGRLPLSVGVMARDCFQPGPVRLGLVVLRREASRPRRCNAEQKTPCALLAITVDIKCSSLKIRCSSKRRNTDSVDPHKYHLLRG